MDVNEYGPLVWKTLHCSAKLNGHCDRFNRFIVYLQKYFPCSLCRLHICENLKLLPLNTSVPCFEWSVKFHNIVNQQLNKPTYEYAKASNDVDTWVRSNPNVRVTLFFSTLFALLKYCENENDMTCTCFLQLSLDLYTMLGLSKTYAHFDTNDIKVAFLGCKRPPVLLLTLMNLLRKYDKNVNEHAILSRYYTQSGWDRLKMLKAA